MKRRPSIATLAIALAAGAFGTTTAAIGADAAATANAEFRRFDANRDGYVSRDEARTVRDFGRALTEADDNRDGRLDAGEFVKAQSVHQRIRAGQYVDDSVVTARVKAALLKDPVVSAVAVSVETYRGTVLLSGFVDDEGQARRAVEVAAGVQGVIAVRNGLAVKG